MPTFIQEPTSIRDLRVLKTSVEFNDINEVVFLIGIQLSIR